MSFRELPAILHRITNHPLTKDQKTASIWRFLKWQISSSLNPKPVIYPFVGNSKLMLRKGIPGATANLYVGLAECQDMSFVLHFLRSSDLFVDIGANIGSYTVLAAGVKQTPTIAIEPIPSTFEMLQENIELNSISQLVQTLNLGLGEKAGTLFFTKNRDMQNHVSPEGKASEDTIAVPVKTLDEILAKQNPALLKIDVEGYEAAVIKGAMQTLNNPSLKAIIMETMGIGNRYGFDEAKIDQQIQAAGFRAYSYDPFKRQLLNGADTETTNSIYIRDIDFINQRLQSAQTQTVLGKTF